MILVDNALKRREAEGNPIRVGLIGAGFMGQGISNQIINSVPGMKLSGIFNRHIKKAYGAYEYAGRDRIIEASTVNEVNDAIRNDKPVVTEDAFVLAQSEYIDVLLDVTGSVEFGAKVTLEAFKNGKDVVLMNAELDATIGPILQVYAEKHNVILSACDGDEPGVQMNLVRWVEGLGLTPRVVGNIKGLQDPYRNPTTQQEWAERWGQNPAMVTSFADGSKISFEQSIVANATGFVTSSRGMSRGKKYEGDIMDIGSIYDIDQLREAGGIIDYVVGTPHTKVFCLAEHTDPKQQHYLKLYKIGDGPLYPFFVPYHLVHFEVPNSIARVSIFRDSIAKPLGGPVVEVCAVAKRDLKKGETLDDYGMYMTYGEAVNTDEMSRQRYLPEGLVEGCILKNDISKDQVLTYDDVELPENRIADTLRAEQYKHFRNEDWLEEYVNSSSVQNLISN
ncbi:NAD(P)-dependent oxidoreductase [Balneolaceae bacterium YR4-1]|uniref:NAD(P)-dependent oxidoreductase n=1 Tax=Halalkalibaculum roseum TaxID=2709311 RepID=A0A6M1SXI8_9BACT|nr:SAF domain-containing protein [Halalkalibaculum roseum]NGP76686.1 NAD(P)-dependent oxidoreductase [Halalkalibaculum roseum]